MKKLKNDYTLDAPYMWGFYPGLCPTILDFVAKVRGLDRGPFNSSFKYCKLGCGNGLTSNVLAESLPQGKFFAVDINAQKIANAKRVAKNSKIKNVTFLKKSFEELLAEDLPKFDYITLHGVYAGANTNTREDVCKVVKKFLKPGGLLYVSYNTMPGWAEFLPMRQIMMNYIANLKDDPLIKVGKALQYLKYLRDNQSFYFINHPRASQVLDALLKKDLHYIMNEYLNESWAPLYFSQVAMDMRKIGLEYCGSANLIKNYPGIVPLKFRSLLSTAETTFDYEVHKSFILDDVFRLDIYCNKKKWKDRKPSEKWIDDSIVGCNVVESDVNREFNFGESKIIYNTDLDNHIIHAAVDGRRTVSEICALSELQTYKKKEVVDSIFKLLFAGQFQVLTTKAEEMDASLPDQFKICSEINRLLLKERLLKDGSCCLASSVLGSSLSCNVILGLLLLAGDNVPSSKLVSNALDILKHSDSTWSRDGKPVTDPKLQRQYLEQRLEIFRNRYISVLLRYGIIEGC